MNAINYDNEMQKIIEKECGGENKPKLLLHACCAPCSSASLERVKDYFDVTVYFYNPNMDTIKEFTKRAEEEKRLCKILGVKCVIEEYEKEKFLNRVKGLEEEKEGGRRCKECFSLRLEKTAEFAKNNNFDYFTTTLTISPLKNATLINEIGKEVGEKYSVKFLPSDFKKGDGYKRSIELSKKYNLYRQNYCGCEFSKRERV